MYYQFRIFLPIVLFFISDASLLKVLNLNFWGLPWPMGVDKNYRIRALREELLIGDYDIVLLQAGTTCKHLHTPHGIISFIAPAWQID